MKRFFTFAAVCLFAAGVLPITAQAQVQTARPNVAIAAKCKGYYEYLPQGYSDAGNTATYPLLLFCSGIGEFGNGGTELSRILKYGPPQIINSGTWPLSFTSGGQSYKFIVISPQFTSGSNPTAADVDTVLNYMLARYRINKTRIYITGLSYSGGLSWAYGGVNTIYSNRVAAIVPIAGAFPPDGTTDIAARSRVMAATNLPVLATHNKSDNNVPASVTLSYISNINKTPAPTPLAKDTIFNVSGHDAWTKTYSLSFKMNNMNIYEWMLQYKRTKVYAASNSPVCPGSTLYLAAYDTAGATYKWTGPNGFTSTSRTPSLTNASSATAGTYTVTVTKGGKAYTASTVVSLTTSKTYYRDANGDGYGTSATKVTATCRPVGYVSASTDCDDKYNKTYPGAWELCDGRDNDCDGVIDDGLTQKIFYQDLDKDGYGNTAVKKSACAAPVGYVSTSGDCNDGNAAVKPSAAEITSNGIDDNCNGVVDEATSAMAAASGADRILEGRLAVAVSPNPAPNSFVLNISSGSNSPVRLRVFDASGRVVDIKQGLPAQQTMRLGQSYKPGVYYAEVMQGTEKVLVKLVKQP